LVNGVKLFKRRSGLASPDDIASLKNSCLKITAAF
jgi:hypothetical protein